jgi:t-SNARE complex subunit (syntaxin)
MSDSDNSAAADAIKVKRKATDHIRNYRKVNKKRYEECKNARRRA